MKASNEVIVVGGGIIGLAIAIELRLKGIGVTVLSRNYEEAATNAAAGMLAPRAEGLTGAMLELALTSLNLYPEWIRKLEHLGGESAEYNPCGIIAPVKHHPHKPVESSHSIWLDRCALEFYQPGLSKEIVGAWWYPEEGQVAPRRLGKVLHQAAQSLGVDIKKGVEAVAFSREGGKIKSILTKSGIFAADTYIVAGGVWSGKLLPLPVTPVKGEMLSLKMPPSQPLSRVIFGENTYLVPKQDGTLIIGATSVNTWQEGNTAQGVNELLQRAIQLYPPLAQWELLATWYGYRPNTPDSMPILGYGDAANLILATGHHRNGILLAPVTAQLIAELVATGQQPELLKHFSYRRFHSPITYATPVANSANCRQEEEEEDYLVIAGRKFRSRLLTGTGKYKSIELMQKSVEASGCEIVTVAVRRVQAREKGHEGLAEALDWSKIWMLPNTAGCNTAEEAVRVARLGREMAKMLGQEDNNFVKLEVIADPKYLLPDPIGTLQAAEQLVKEGFAVLPYVNADPLLCKRLEEVGCVTVMPLGSPIGSGQGIRNLDNIRIIIEQSKVPVIIDAGIGTPSDAALGMEMGADALLINTAIACADNPVKMAKAFRLATESGRLAYKAGRIPVKSYAQASSPTTGLVK
ncbi:MAG: glycine oxidase ThiO [Geminocystis sp.]|nr:glycine oxidase ThiO [Geminocystis sp.]MDW8463787.1 glycine oxidase ThiO [Geminocystis sp.]HIK37488.1 glycine oxidase ThiO [Geminocystis sp. M7585_C2015_104]